MYKIVGNIFHFESLENPFASIDNSLRARYFYGVDYSAVSINKLSRVPSTINKLSRAPSTCKTTILNHIEGRFKETYPTIESALIDIILDSEQQRSMLSTYLSYFKGLNVEFANVHPELFSDTYTKNFHHLYTQVYSLNCHAFYNGTVNDLKQGILMLLQGYDISSCYGLRIIKI